MTIYKWGELRAWFLLFTVIWMAGCGGNGGGSGGGTASGGTTTTLTSPTVSSTNPANAATNVSINQTLTATFSEAMDEATINTTTFSMTDDGFIAVTGTVEYNAATRVATFTPSNFLDSNRTYTMTITTGVTNVAGTPLASDVIWSFATSSDSGPIPPLILRTSPEDLSTNVALNQKVRVDFSEEMNPSSLTSSSFMIRDAGGASVSGTVDYDATHRSARFTPASPLDPNVTYTGTVTTGVTDAAGNALGSEFTWTFTTGNASDSTAPVMVSTIPNNGETGVPIDASITVTFDEEIDSFTLNSNTFTLRRQGETTLLTGTLSYNGPQASFTPDVLLWNNTGYVVILTTAITDMSGNALSSDVTVSFTTTP